VAVGQLASGVMTPGLATITLAVPRTLPAVAFTRKLP
jgi:hypothetical protein